MANLLDLFAIGFNSEGIKDFQKNLKTTESELDKAEKKVSALEKELDNLEKSTDKDDKAIERVKLSLVDARYNVVKFGDEVKKMQGQSEFQILKLKKNFMSLVKAVGLLASVGVAVRQSIVFYEQAEQLDFLAQKSNIAVESLHRLGIAAQKYGGNTESTASTVEQFISKEFKEKALKVGVSVAKDNPEQTLENIAAKMEKLKTDADKWELAKSLGLDEATTRMLVQGVERYREELKRANKYKLYTKEDIERMKDYQQVQQDIRQGVQTIQAVIARLLLPALTAIAKAIRVVTDWIAEHQGGVKIAAIFIGISAAVLSVVGVVKLLIPLFGLISVETRKLIGVWAGWIAVITLIIAIIQDLIVFIQGGDSVIGKLWESWGYDLEEIRAGFEIWGERIKRWWNNFLSIFNKKIEWQNDMKDIDVIKGSEADKKMAKQIADYNLKNDRANYIEYGQKILLQANNNKLNSISQGAISNSYQTQALTNNTNSTTTVNIGTINTQAKDGQELASELNTVADKDNGLNVA